MSDDDPRARWRHLPDAIRLEDTISSAETENAPDPEGGLDPERIFLQRFLAL